MLAKSRWQLHNLRLWLWFSLPQTMLWVVRLRVMHLRLLPTLANRVNEGRWPQRLEWRDGGDVLCNEHILFFQIPVVGGLWGFSLGFSSQTDNSGLGAGWTISGSQSMEITQPWERTGCGAGQDRSSFLFPNWTQSSANYVVLGLEALWVLGCEVC